MHPRISSGAPRRRQQKSHAVLSFRGPRTPHNFTLLDVFSIVVDGCVQMFYYYLTIPLFQYPLVTGLVISQEDREIHCMELEISDIINRENNYYTWVCLKFQAVKKTLVNHNFPRLSLYQILICIHFVGFRHSHLKSRNLQSNLCTHQQTPHAAPLLDESGVCD